MPSVEEILSVEFDSTFSLRPSQEGPLTPDVDFARPSVASTFNANRDIVEKQSGEPRIFGSEQSLLLEPSRTQLFSSPQDFTSSDWQKTRVTVSNTGTSKGQNRYKIAENNDTDTFHQISQSFTANDGDPIAVSAIVKSKGRDWVRILLNLQDNSNINTFFNVEDGSIGQNTESTSAASIREQSTHEIGNGFYLIKFVAIPDNPDDKFTKANITLAREDGTIFYDGSGSLGVDILAAQAEVGRFTTTPILSGGPTRDAESLTIAGSDFANDEEGTYFIEAKIRAEETNANFPIRFNASIDRLKSNFNAPFSWSFFDASVNSPIFSLGSVSAYEVFKIAVAYNSQEVRVAIDGNSKRDSSTYDGDIGAENVSINRNAGAPLSVFDVSYSPRMLSPLDLETLTS